jgi:uracil-DNA glycosylase
VGFVVGRRVRAMSPINLPFDLVDSLRRVEAEVISCRACPRLVAWRELVAREKRAAFRDWVYWGRPVPGFGDPRAHLLVVGLAPAAHGGNRTGRVFTGDRSGDFLFASLHRCGYANQPTSDHIGDGLRLHGAYITATVKCAPPANKPTPSERDTCHPYLEREIALLSRLRVVVALGQFGWDAVVAHEGLRPRPRFGHGAEVALPSGRVLLGSYHVSQQNTFTRKLTPAMLDAVFARARALAPDG